jgi:general secretion pathway protein C
MNAMTLQANDLVRLLQGHAVQRMIPLVNVLLVIWMASQLASLTWGLLPQADTDNEPVAVVTRTAVPAQRNQLAALIAQLPGWHLMGVAIKQAAPVLKNTPLDAPDTRLSLTLMGALASDDKRNARAIIAEKGGKEEHYAIGDNLPGNAELSAIYPDRVILRRGGRYETLRLPTDIQSGGNIAAITSTHLPAAPAERLRKVRENIRNSPRSLYELVRTSQQLDESGNIIGYSVEPGRNPDLFEEVGLESGDVIVEVNGLGLNEPANGSKALRSLASGEAVTVKLLRGGQEHVLTLEAQE